MSRLRRKTFRLFDIKITSLSIDQIPSPQTVIFTAMAPNCPVSIATCATVAGPTRADMRGVSNTLPSALGSTAKHHSRMGKLRLSDWPPVEESQPPLTNQTSIKPDMAKPKKKSIGPRHSADPNTKPPQK